MAAQAAIPEAFVLASEVACVTDKNGVVRPHPQMLYSAMTLQATLYNQLLFALRDLCGGSVIQSGPEHPLHWCGINRLYPACILSISNEAA